MNDIIPYENHLVVKTKTVSFEPEELDIISYLSNPIVRANVRNIALKLKPKSGMGKILLPYYLELSSGYKPEDGSIEAHLKNNKLESAEINLAIAKKISFCEISAEGCDSLIKRFYKYFRGEEIQKILNDFFKESAEIENKSDAEDNLISSISNLELINGTLFELTDLSEENISEILSEEISSEDSKIPSVFEFIKESSAYNSYLKSWIVLWCAPPGVGKTMLMMNEVCNMAKLNYKIIWVALGDMVRSDFLIRLTAIITGVTIDEVILDPEEYINDEVLSVFSRIRLNIQPAGEMTSTELVNNILGISKEDFDYDVVVIDYDDNLKDKDDQNMYKEGKDKYKELTRISRQKGNFKLVFVASQVKQELWETEILQRACCASSSAKQPVVDVQLNYNRNRNNKRFGTMNVAKQRRGVETMAKMKINLNGRFEVISRPDYESATGR